MKKKLIVVFLVLVMAVCVFPISAFADSPSDEEVMPRYVVKYRVEEGRTDVSLRRQPGLSSEVIGYVQGGEYFDPIWDQTAENGNTTYVTGMIDGHKWAHVSMHPYTTWANTVGFIANEYVQTVFAN